MAGDVHPQSAPSLRARISGPRVRGHEHAAEPVDRSRPVRVTGLGERGGGDRDAHGSDAGVDPEQALPSGRLDQHPADERAGGGPDRRCRTPQRDRPQLRSPRVATVSRLRPQATMVAPGGALDRPAMTTPPQLGERDEHAGSDEQQQPELEDAPPPEHVAQRTGGDDERRADEHVAGHRPLQGAHRGVDVLADRRQQDRHRGGVGVDHQRRDARGRQDRARRWPAARSRTRRWAVIVLRRTPPHIWADPSTRMTLAAARPSLPGGADERSRSHPTDEASPGPG